MGPSLGPRRWLARLFDQQLWCFGRDIASGSGNVFLRLGMCRVRPLGPSGGSTQYQALTPSGAAVTLWGFGVMIADGAHGRLFLRRYRFDPRLVPGVPRAAVHHPEGLGALLPPRTASELAGTRQLLSALARWFAEYEHWVAEECGPGYRAGTLAAWDRVPVVPAPKMAAAWERGAKWCRRYQQESYAKTAWCPLVRQLRGRPVMAIMQRPSTKVSR